MYDLMEQTQPDKYNPLHMSKHISHINDILQGRHPIKNHENLILMLESAKAQRPQQAAELIQDIRDFRAAIKGMEQPYTLIGDKVYKYKYKWYEFSSDPPKKIINQRTYEHAVKAGFPPGFFRESYFDKVHFHALPEQAEFNFSTLNDCNFVACRAEFATFASTRIYNTDFHSCNLRYADFYHSQIAHSHFRDSDMSNVSLHRANIRRCNFIDNTMNNTYFLRARLDGCSFDSIKTKGVNDLETARFAMSGATEAESKRNEESNRKALQAPPERAKDQPQKER